LYSKSDKFGGTLENRARFLILAIDAVPKAVGPGFPIELRLNGDEFLKGAMTENDYIELGKIVQNKVDLIVRSTVVGCSVNPIIGFEFDNKYTPKKAITLPCVRRHTVLEQPDVLIVAAGASSIIPNIPGVNLTKVILATDSEKDVVLLDEKIVILGGGLIGCETGISHGMLGKNITIVEMRDELEKGANEFHMLGDCVQAGQVTQAVQQGYYISREI
jgi:hypothetical protein